MKNWIFYFLLLILPLKLQSQNDKLYLSDCNFNIIFNNAINNASHYHQGTPKLDAAVIAESNEGVDFLITKLEKENGASMKAVILQYLSYSEEQRVVELLSTFVKSDEESLYRTSINALLKYQTDESTKILEQHLSALEVGHPSQYNLIEALSLNMSLTSIEVLDKYQKKIDSNNKLFDVIENAKQDIQIFNKDSAESIRMINHKLYSDKNQNVLWCIRLLNLHKNEKYLPVIRDYHLGLGDDYANQYPSINMLLLILRQRLSDDSLGKKENLQKQAEIKAEIRERTMALLRKRNQNSNCLHNN